MISEKTVFSTKEEEYTLLKSKVLRPDILDENYDFITLQKHI